MSVARTTHVGGMMLALAGLGTYALAASPPDPPVPETVTVQVHACTPAEEGEWKFVRDEQMGVQASARLAAGWVGLTAATDGFHDWAPLDDFKTTICGQLARFDTFEPNRERKILQFLPEIPEHDWNIILIPTPSSIFDERFKLAAKLMERGHEGDLLACPAPCFEAEVTPQRNLLTANTAGRWLSACRRGQTLCVFGPWVGDGGHGYRPEIHPAERIWWRDGERLKLLFVQDASQRFVDRRHYQWKWGHHEPGDWHPWAAPGLEGDFRLAFQITKGSTISMRVDQLLDTNTRRVLARASPRERDFALEQGTDPVGTIKVVVGLGARSDRLELDLSKLDVAVVGDKVGPGNAVVLGDVCERDGLLQGYVRIHDKVGYGYQEGEGFDAFEVTLPPLPGAGPDDRKHVEGADEGRDSLHASVRIVAQEEDTHESVGGLAPGILNDLLQAALDKKRTPPDESTPPEEPERKEVQQAEARQRMTTTRADVVVGFARRFRLSALPHYDGPRGERIESAIDKARREDFQRLLAAAPAPLPEKVHWDLEVRDVSAHADLPRDRVTLTCKQRLLIDDDCVLDLPANVGPPERVLHVRATARLIDGNGDPIPAVTVIGSTAVGNAAPARQEIRLASHFIRATKSDSAEKVLAWLAEADPSGRDVVRLAGAKEESRPDGTDPIRLNPYRREYYARMLRHGVALATADGRITIDELGQFVEMAQALGELPALTEVPLPPTVK